MPVRPDIYLVDSSIYIFRAWFLLPDTITDRHGQPVNALFGFADFLIQLLEQTRATHIACAFDQSLTTSARNQLYPAYKANREPAPPELKQQFQRCRALCDAFGLAQFAHEQFEADDIIGTLATSIHRHGGRSTIVTADKDLAQFIHSDDEFWDFARKKRMNQRGVEKRFGVRPEQIADMLALSGDKVDNIPGIPGVGMATAARLLTRWDTLDNLFANADAVAEMKFRGAARVSKLLREHEDTVRLSRQLTGLLPVDSLPTTIDALQRKPLNTDEAELFLADNGFSENRAQRLLNAMEALP